MARRRIMKNNREHSTARNSERAILVGLARGSTKRAIAQELLDELAELARSAGAAVVDSQLQMRPHPDPGTYVGKGMVEKLRQIVEEKGATVVIFDDPLSPAQMRNLERALEVSVVDRSRLILDIFAKRARTAEAMTQVELAQLEYLLPRLTRAWTHLERQEGAIGTRGPGETQLEVDRRLIRKRITILKEKLAKITSQRHTRRHGREQYVQVAFVGYTNAGKSTLFNALTKANVAAADRLFMTLDPTSRVLSSQYPIKAILTDTVGFIRKLPHELVESFKSTLEEVVRADVLIHVVDCSDPSYLDKITQTERTLSEIGANAPVIFVYTKADLNAEFTPPALRDNESFIVSAQTGVGLSALKERLLLLTTERSAAGARA